MFRRTTALLALLILVGGIASAQQPSKQKTAASQPGRPKSSASKGAGASLDATLDLNKIVDDIAGTITANKNREAWVKALLEKTMSRTGGKYNVMVFNLQQNYEFNPPAGTSKFARATFKGGLSGD